MAYKITAPNGGYNRRLMGVQFTNGAAETDNAWAAGWFSGRSGFTVEAITDDSEKPSAKKAGKKADDEQGTAD